MNKYEVIDQLQKGQFGTVYKARHKITGNYVALKYEKKSHSNSLKNEAKIYQYLTGTRGFPNLKWFESTEIYNLLVLDLLGPSIGQVINNAMLCLDNILQIGIQMIKRIETLHSMFLVHRDIKPDNFLLDITFNIKKESVTDYFENNGEVYLIDFGLCKRYDYNGVHIEQKKISSIIGSYNFVSLNVLNGIEPSRRDDIESALYVMIYMYLGHLNWVPNKENILEYITIPNVIKQSLLYVKTLDFTSQPDYNLICDILLNKNDIKR